MLHTLVYYGILVMRVAKFREVGDLGLWKVLGFCGFRVQGIGISAGSGFSGFGFGIRVLGFPGSRFRTRVYFWFGV